jgi:hypothetical protein
MIAAVTDVGRVMIYLVSMAIVSACSVVEAPPAHQLVLPGTAWSVLAVGDYEVPAQSPVVLAFETVDLASLDTGCQSLGVGYVWDSDGAALSFVVPSDPMEGCDSAAAQQDEVVRDGLDSIASWRVVDSDTVELYGASVIRLLRLPGGSD